MVFECVAAIYVIFMVPFQLRGRVRDWVRGRGRSRVRANSWLELAARTLAPSLTLTV